MITDITNLKAITDIDFKATDLERSAVLSAIRKDAGQLSTLRRNIRNQDKSTRRDLANALRGMLANISLNTRE